METEQVACLSCQQEKASLNAFGGEKMAKLFKQWRETKTKQAAARFRLENERKQRVLGRQDTCDWTDYNNTCLFGRCSPCHQNSVFKKPDWVWKYILSIPRRDIFPGFSAFWPCAPCAALGMKNICEDFTLEHIDRMDTEKFAAVEDQRQAQFEEKCVWHFDIKH